MVFKKGMRSLLDPSDPSDTVPARPAPPSPAPLERDDLLDLDVRPDSDAEDPGARDREGRPADLEDPEDLEDLEDPEERSALDEIPDTSERAVEEEEEEVEEEEEEETLLLDGISDTVDKAVVDLIVSGSSGAAGITIVLQGESLTFKTGNLFFIGSAIFILTLKLGRLEKPVR